MKRQFLHESHNLQDKAKKPDYRERFQDEGKYFDRGGKRRSHFFPGVLKWTATTITFDLRPAIRKDKGHLLEDLQCKWRFEVNGHVGTLADLIKNPTLRPVVEQRLQLMATTIRNSDTIVDVATHPKSGRQTEVLEFKCPFKPAEPIPKPIFKKHLAFKMNLVGPALTGC